MRKLGVMMVLPAFAVLAACNDSTTEPPAPNVVEVAQSVNAQTGEFSTLIAAIVRAGLVDDLSAAGPFTVFAPTDAAFAALGLNASNIATVPIPDLTAILLYHVAPGRLAASAVVARNQITMAGGGVTQVRLENGAAFINDARILTTDVDASNGVIHIINAVLMP
jgi:uncharacterized surface protein with fasciclin (FAS1) repeats